MPLSRKRLAVELLRATYEFHSMRPWERFGNQDLVAVRVPGQDHPVWVSIMGAAGEEFGLAVYVGERAADQLVEKFESSLVDEDLIEREHFLAFGMCPYSEIPTPARKILELAGFQGRRETPAPWLMTKEPGQRARQPNRDETELLLFITRALLATVPEEAFEPVRFGEGERSPLLVLSGDPRRPDVAVEAIEPTVTRWQEAPPAFDLPLGAAELPVREGTWQVAFPVLPVEVTGDSRTVRVIVVLDPEAMVLVGSSAVSSPALAGPEFYRFAMQAGGDAGPGLPTRVLFSSRTLHRLLGPSLQALGIEARHDARLPEVEEATDRLLDQFSDGDDSIPETDDLEGWKRAELEFTSGILGHLGRDTLLDPRNLRTFFGDEKAGGKFLLDEQEQGSAPSYMEWLLCHYRPEPGGRRLGRMILSSGRLSPVERILLRNRLEGRVSFYRIDRVGEDGRVRLLDILDGTGLVIRDFSLAADADVEGASVAMNVFTAGEFRLPIILSPAFLSSDLEEALDHLEEFIGPLSQETLAAKPEVLGRLWPLRERQLARGPETTHLINADHHRISMRKATFRAGEAEGVREALLYRDDFLDDGPDVVRFRQYDDPQGAIIGPTKIGTVSFESGRIEVTANSVERMAEMRRILAELPGVVFVSEQDVTPKHLRRKRSSRKATRPVRHVIVEQFLAAGRSDEEAIEEAASRTTRFYLNWVDNKLPDLGDRSPRECCETEEGRRRIRRRILAMPRPGTDLPPDWDLPRREMLRSLGLPEPGQRDPSSPR